MEHPRRHGVQPGAFHREAHALHLALRDGNAVKGYAGRFDPVAPHLIQRREQVVLHTGQAEHPGLLANDADIPHPGPLDAKPQHRAQIVPVLGSAEACLQMHAADEIGRVKVGFVHVIGQEKGHLPLARGTAAVEN